jgi:hypothetical protein
MKYGFEGDRFFLDLESCSRPHGTFREEHERRAQDIAAASNNIWLSLSGGVDSQSMLHSFMLLGVPVTCAFMHLPGYNDNEYDQIKILDKKYGGLKLEIVTFDVQAIEREVVYEGIRRDMPTLINILQRKFLSALPGDCDLVQQAHDPFVWINPESRNSYYYQGYYLPEISRARMFESVKRTGRVFFWGDTPEMLASILDDEIYRSAVYTSEYFDGNGAIIEGKYLRTVDRWDYYIKPLVYGKYWKDELIYFPKFAGTEKINYISGNEKFKKHAVVIPYFKFLDFLNSNDGHTERFYENVPYMQLDQGQDATPVQ